MRSLVRVRVRSEVPRSIGRRPGIQAAIIAQLDRPKGAGLFVLSDPGKLVLGRKFLSDWATR